MCALVAAFVAFTKLISSDLGNNKITLHAVSVMKGREASIEIPPSPLAVAHKIHYVTIREKIYLWSNTLPNGLI